MIQVHLTEYGKNPGPHGGTGNYPHRSGSWSYPLNPEERRVSTNYAGNGPYQEVDAAIKEPVRILNEELGWSTYASCEGHKENWLRNHGVLGDVYDSEGKPIGKDFQQSYIAAYATREKDDSLIRTLVQKEGFEEGSTQRQTGDEVNTEYYKNLKNGTYLKFDIARSPGGDRVAFRISTGHADINLSPTLHLDLIKQGLTLRNLDDSVSGQHAFTQPKWDSSRDAGWREWIRILKEK